MEATYLAYKQWPWLAPGLAIEVAYCIWASVISWVRDVWRWSQCFHGNAIMFYSISAEKGDGGWGREEPTVWWRSDNRNTNWGKYCTEYPPHACRVRTVVASWPLEGSSYAQPPRSRCQCLQPAVEHACIYYACLDNRHLIPAFCRFAVALVKR